MNRRELLAGLALAGFPLEGQQHEPESLYIPKAHLVQDRTFLHDFMDEFAFVDLITAAPAIRVTHLPVWLDRSAGKFGTIHGHISRNNTQNKTFDGEQTGVVVFRGPHAYISPTWYAKIDAVPTWNFGVVHATGKLKPVSDPKALHELLARLIAKFEDYRTSAYDFAKLPEKSVTGMMAGIVGFEMEIELLEGKFKLGQERSEADRASIVAHLESAKPERSMHDFTAAFYRRAKNAEQSGD